MKNTRRTILAALLLAATSVTNAQAQRPAGAGSVDPRGGGSEMAAQGGAPGGAATAPSAATDSGAVTNAQTTETTTTTSTEGIGPDGISMEVDPTLETTELANTGGEPVLMSLIGLSMALGAFAVRKRVSA